MSAQGKKKGFAYVITLLSLLVGVVTKTVGAPLEVVYQCQPWPRNDHQIMHINTPSTGTPTIPPMTERSSAVYTEPLTWYLQQESVSTSKECEQEKVKAAKERTKKNQMKELI